jgi:hypothetical protein
MPNKIKPKRSYTANAVPVVSGNTPDIEQHEMAVNWTDGKLFTRDANNQLVSITLGGSGSIPTASASVLGGVKVGSGLTITDGVLAASGGGEDTALRALFVPPAPTSVTATAGNAQATVSWTAPAALSTLPITDYTVQFSTNSGSTWTTFTRAASTATSATVTGLTNGTAHVFRVAGVNAVGQGAWSTATSSVTPGVPTDPYFSNVALLLHCDGSNGSTTFTDLSLNGHAITRYGNAAISTTQSRFGGASLYLDGDGDYLEIPDHASFDFGAGEFTIEFWAFCTDQSTPYPTYIANGTAGFESGSWSIRYDNSGQPQRFGVFWNPSDPLHSTASAYSFNQWRHVAVVRDGNTIRTYVDGVQQASTAVDAGRTLDLTQGGHGRIGSARWDGGNGFLKDYIDSFRITKGVCRYPSGTTFTPPTAAFPDA